MARVFGPMLSASATGQYGHLIGFVQTRRGTAARLRPAANDPQTAKQTATRAMFRFLSTQWPLLTPAQQSTWHPLADQAHLDAAMSFRGENLKRWGQFRPPSKAWPATEDDTQPIAGSNNARGGPSRIRLQYTVSVVNDAWGLIIHRTTPPLFAISRSNVIAVIPTLTPGQHVYYDHGLAPGQYWYDAEWFTRAGSLGPPETRLTATAT